MDTLTPKWYSMRPESSFLQRFELWTCSPDGEEQYDITEYVVAMTVSYNFGNEIKGSLNVTLRENPIERAIITCLKPIVDVRWRDSSLISHWIREPLGIFYYLMPDQDVSETQTLRHIQGMSGEWRLGHLTAIEPAWFPVGTDYGQIARDVLIGTSPVPLNLPLTGKTSTNPRGLRRNDYRFVQANNAYMSGDFMEIACDRFGVASTRPRTVQSPAQPARIIDSSKYDILSNIRMMPARDQFFNQIIISGNNPDAELTIRDGISYRFIDPESPFSIVNGPTITHEIKDSRDEDIEVMKNRALTMLEAACCVQNKISFATWPDPRFEPYEMWQIKIQQAQSVGGKYPVNGYFQIEQLDYTMIGDSVALLVTATELANIEMVV